MRYENMTPGIFLARVLHMDHLGLPVDLHMGDEPIGPGQKNPRGHILITHGAPPVLPTIIGEG